jgi:ureidoacrylate peracid hydrolase
MEEKVLRTLGEQIRPEHTALIVIDPQEDFIGTNGYAALYLGWDVSRLQTAMRRLNNFLPKARGAGVKLIWVRTTYGKDTLTPNVKALWSGMETKRVPQGKGPQPKFVKEGTPGANWWSEMTGPRPDEAVITKWHYDSFEDTNLDLLLRSSGIKTLVITGVLTNVCCETTLRHAFVKGYYGVLVSDCTDTVSQQQYQATLLNVRKHFVIVASSGEVLEAWQLLKVEEG